MSTSRADVLRRLAAQGLTTLRASTSNSPEALAVAADEAQGPDPVVIALVDAINDRLDGLASTAPMAASRQARQIAGAFASWAALTARGQEDDASMSLAIVEPVGDVLDHLAATLPPGHAALLAKSIGEWLFKIAEERWGSD